MRGNHNLTPLTLLFCSNNAVNAVRHAHWISFISSSFRSDSRSKTHRTISVGRALWRSHSPTPAKAGPPRAGDTGTHPDGFGVSPGRETPHNFSPSWFVCPRFGKMEGSFLSHGYHFRWGMKLILIKSLCELCIYSVNKAAIKSI